MDWLEITVTTNTLGADIVSEALIRQGAKGTQIIDRADVPDPDKPSGFWELIDQKMIDDMPKDVLVRAWFASPEDVRGLEACLAALSGLAKIDLGTLALSTQNVNEQDWAECWKQYYKPFRAGKRLVIRPSWEPYEAEKDDLIIELDPGMAFGTGTHETTRMCVEMIEKHFAGGAVLDVGTGSGILAIAAARLGAKSVLAVDIDPTAVKVARENVEKNGLENTVEVRQGDLVKGIGAVCDFAVANILADVVRMLAKPLNNHLRAGGIFVCSGIIKEREQDVVEALTEADYTLVDRMEMGEWVALAARNEKGA